ncbi:MAG TPA: type I polyketide synthase [Streptosporangiaceae bacterium]|nr:type I polyketide synthase [Streptosporangiaceae bacterium]
MADDQVLGALRASLKEADRLRQRNRQLVAAAQAPLAITGMSCRLPGGIQQPEELWELLATDGDAISSFPPDRGWDLDRMTATALSAGEPARVPAGGFVSAATDFDAGFFRVSPREALGMDPQQRLVLETAWEALERTGIQPERLRGSATGVFIGAWTQHYAMVVEADTQAAQGFLPTSDVTSVISGRVAYTFGLEGPAVTVDTACSSSLTALHLAARALRSGECDMALAGGVTVYATPAAFAFTQKLGLSPDGRCKAFAAAADGMGMSEGAAVIVLERLSDARRHGHPVLAVVRGSAMNQDGASNGFTAPNGPAQQRVIRAALANAQLRPDQVDAVEAHGTGTTLGDPIEAQALLATYGQGRAGDRPLWLGSVKSNIGHTQAAAGVSGVMKMVLALQHQLLPRTLHVDEPSPHVDWSAGAVRLVTEPVPWPASGQPRRAGVSSFGITGTNVHVILEEAPDLASTPAEDGEAPAGRPGPAPVVLDHEVLPWVVSGQSAAALRAQAERLRAHVADRPELSAADVGFSLAASRSAFRFRAVVTGSDRAELLAGLAAVAAGEPAAGVVTGALPPGGDVGRTVFVFPGHGVQWAGMGRELAVASPVFAARLAECGRALAPHTGWDLGEALAGADGAAALDRAEVIQPVLWAVMVSLAAVWQAAGIVPDAVVGHSQGEIAAACVAGILSLEDAATVVARRSRALTELAGSGGMISVVKPAGEVAELLAPWASRLSVAAVNGPLATVVAGELGALAEFETELSARRIPRWRIPEQDFVAHSAQVEKLADPLRSALAAVRPGPARIPFYSTVTCEWMNGTELDAGYWYANVRQTVRFAAAIRALAESGHQIFVEVSPHPVFGGAIQDTVEALGAAAAPVTCGTLVRDDGGARRLLASLAQVYVHGGAVNWAAVLSGGDRVDLPTYAFQHQRYWPRPSAGRPGDVTSAGLDSTGHPLLGAATGVAQGDELLLTGRLSLRTHPWLADHAADGLVLLPGTAFAELAIRTADAAGCGRVADLTLEAPLVVPEKGAVRIQVTVGGPGQAGDREIEMYSRPEEAGPGTPWKRHASGLLAAAGPSPADPAWAGELREWPPPGAAAVPVDGLYEALGGRGHGYGPVFRGLQAVWRRGDELFAEVALPAGAAADAAAFGLHPALLDATLHAAGLAAWDASMELGGALLPFAWAGISLHAAGASALRARLRTEPASGRLSLAAVDIAGAPVISVESLMLRPISAGQLETAQRESQESLFTEEWTALPGSVSAAGPAGRWAVIGADPLGLGAGLRMAGADVRVAPDLTTLMTSAGPAEPIPDVIAASVGTAAAAPDGNGTAPGDAASAARAAAGQALRLVQQWLDEGQSARLILVTRGAVATGPEDRVTDPAGAAAWGLARSAQLENPGWIVLADLSATVAPGDAGEAAVLAAALAAGEPELAIRGQAAYGRRLTRAGTGVPGPGPESAGRVLITGGTGALGRLMAQHMVAARGARHVMLASRSGPGAAGIAAIAADLAGRGAGAEVIACDAADRGALAALLTRIPAASPLTTVLHLAGILDDGMIASLTQERVATVMRAKADAAWNLHQLTQDLDLQAFVLFSSVAAILGSPGQGNYAAANAFLDALARQRRAAGLPATSVAWGLWAQDSAMTHRVSEGTRAAMASAAMSDLTAAEGTALLDRAVGRDDAVLVAMNMNLAILRSVAQSETLPAVLQRLAGSPGRRTARTAATESGAQALRERLARSDEAGQEQLVSGLVRSELAALLGYPAAEDVEMEVSFLELGLDSMSQVMYRNRLNELTGLRLPGTAMFDNPTPALLARRLREELSGPGLPSGKRGRDRSAGKRRYVASKRAVLAGTAPDADPAQRALLAHSLGGLYEQAAATGKLAEIMQLITGLAAFRPAFSAPSELEHVPPPVPVAQGAAAPSLICLPSFVGRSGAREYVRFAREFRGVRPVSVLPAPGFADGEPLARSADALACVHAENILRSVPDAPFVLVGYSSGGLAAHALTTRLESIGRAPAALVLMDTEPLDQEMMSGGHLWSFISGQVLADIRQQEDAGDDAWLTAFAHYFTLDWTGLKPIAGPTLIVRSEEFVPGVPEDRGDAGMSLPCSGDVTTVQVPGGHFTMMTDHAGTTAHAVSEWLAEL